MKPTPHGSLSNRTRAELLLAIAANWTVVAAITTVAWATTVGGVAWLWYGKSPFAAFEDWAETRRMVCMHLDIADAMIDAGQVTEAREEYLEALELDKINIQARRGLLKTAIMEPIAGEGYNPAAAHIRLDALARSDPKDPHVDLYLGHLLVAADPRTAEGHYRNAIDKATNRPSCDDEGRRSEVADAYNGLGEIHLTAGRLPKALAEYERAANLASGNPAFVDNHAYLALLTGDYQTSARLAEKAILLNPEELGSYYTFVNAQLMLGQPWLARWAVEGLIALIEERKLALHTNIGAWGLHVPPDRMVWLQAEPQKVAYAHLLAATVATAEGRLEAALSAFNAAAATGAAGAEASHVDAIFDADLERYATEQPDIAGQVGRVWQQVVAERTTARSFATADPMP